MSRNKYLLPLAIFQGVFQKWQETFQSPLSAYWKAQTNKILQRCYKMYIHFFRFSTCLYCITKCMYVLRRYIWVSIYTICIHYNSLLLTSQSIILHLLLLFPSHSSSLLRGEIRWSQKERLDAGSQPSQRWWSKNLPGS